MRVAIVAPWFRTLAQIHGRALERRGHEVRVLTTDAHFQSGYRFVPEQLLDPRIKSASWPAQWWQRRGDLRRWGPDVVLVDQSWDIRLTSFSSFAPSALVVHDAVPHDTRHTSPGWQRAAVRRLRRRARHVVCFSHAVAAQLAGQTSASVAVVPLTSELPEEQVGPFVEAEDRRDFLVLGRVSPYKNLDSVFAGWAAHVGSTDYRGDQLVLLGDGRLDAPLPAACRWERGRFDFATVAPRLGRFKGSVALYEGASQSGAQVTSMQVGVMPVASTSGGLPEYQPPARPSLPPHDVRGLAAAFAELADPARAAAEGRLAQQHYRARCLDDVTAAALAAVCDDLAGGTR